MSRSKGGQSVLEYVVILTAVIAAVLLGAGIMGSKSSQRGLGKLLNRAATKITIESAKIKDIIK